MKRSYIAVSCSACDKRGKAGRAEGMEKKSRCHTDGSPQDRAIAVQRTTLLSVPVRVYGERPGDRSNTGSTRVTRNRLHGIRPIRRATCNEEERKGEKKETQRDRTVRVSREGRVEFVCVLMNTRIIAILSPSVFAVPSMPTMTFTRNCRTVAGGRDLVFAFVLVHCSLRCLNLRRQFAYPIHRAPFSSKLTFWRNASFVQGNERIIPRNCEEYVSAKLS